MRNCFHMESICSVIVTNFWLSLSWDNNYYIDDKKPQLRESNERLKNNLHSYVTAIAIELTLQILDCPHISRRSRHRKNRLSRNQRSQRSRIQPDRLRRPLMDPQWLRWTSHHLRRQPRRDLHRKTDLGRSLHFDWEAISTAPCERGGSDYCIYIGDTGDIGWCVTTWPCTRCLSRPGRRWRRTLSLPRGTGARPFTSTLTDKAATARAFSSIRTSGEIFVIEKAFATTPVFSAPLDVQAETTTSLEYTEIDLPILFTTDATSDEDGKILVRGYKDVLLFDGSRGIRETLSTSTPCRAKLVFQRQGEGIALMTHGEAYFIHGEGVGEDLIKFELEWILYPIIVGLKKKKYNSYNAIACLILRAL